MDWMNLQKKPNRQRDAVIFQFGIRMTEDVVEWKLGEEGFYIDFAKNLKVIQFKGFWEASFDSICSQTNLSIILMRVDQKAKQTVMFRCERGIESFG